MSEFNKLITKHIQSVNGELQKVSEELQRRGQEHDHDKIEKGYVNDVYENYFPQLKKIDFGSAEYLEFEREHFSQAHYMHVQNRHHFYDHRNQTTDVNLFDFLEAIIDIKESNKQYSTFDIDNVMAIIKSKGLFEQSLEEMTRNTISALEENER